MKITIVEGGNIRTQFAVHCAEKRHKVVIYTSKPEFFIKHLSIVDKDNKTTHEGDIAFTTNDPELAFRDADFIMVTMPATMMRAIAEVIYCHSRKESMIGIVPENGRSECAFRKCIDRGNIFFGIERVPAIARLVKKGQTVKSTGYRDELHVSSLPIANAKKCADMISGIFDMPCKVIPNFLNLIMIPSNPILLTTRLRTLFGDWHHGIIYDSSVPLFYEEWENAYSKLLMHVMKKCRKYAKRYQNFIWTM